MAKKTQTFRASIADIPDKFHLTTMLFDLKGQSDYAVAVVTVSKLDYSLRQRLEAHFVNKSDEDLKRYFSGVNPAFNSLQVKIELAFALGLIENNDRKDIATLKGIRNIFAHTAATINMEKSEIATAVRSLHILKANLIQGTIDELSVKELTILAAAHLGSKIVAPLLDPFSSLYPG